MVEKTFFRPDEHNGTNIVAVVFVPICMGVPKIEVEYRNVPT